MGRVLALAIVGLLGGCHPEPVAPTAETENSPTGSTDEADHDAIDEVAQPPEPSPSAGLVEQTAGPLAETTVGPSIEATLGVDPEAALHGHAHRPRGDERTPTEIVTDALYAARYAAGLALRARLPEPSRAPGDGGDSRRIRVVFGSNVHGELEDCGCRRHPLGGLARRATLVDDWLSRPAFDIAVHLDTGDSLFRAPFNRPEADLDHAHEAIGARTILQAFALTNVAAMGVGHLDLAMGPAFLTGAAREAGVPLVTTNIRVDGRPIGVASVLLEDAGFVIGVTGVTAEPVAGSSLPSPGGVEIGPAAAAVAPYIGALRDQPVDLVILLGASIGLSGAVELLDELSAASALPDIVLVSGSNRMIREPTWSQSVPVLEAASRGKQLMVVDLQIVDRSTDFAPRGGGLADLIDRYVSTLRALNLTEANLRRVIDDPERGSQRDAYISLRKGQASQLAVVFTRMADARALLEAPSPRGPASQISVELHDVELDIAEREDVRSVVEAATVAMGADPAFRPRR